MDGCASLLGQSWKVVVFTTNMCLGLILSQVLGATLDHHTYEAYREYVGVATMWCLSFIMMNVGYEFTIDKKALREYQIDGLVGMAAAGLPWIFTATWFILAIGNIEVGEGLLIALFAAPTSAGILFSMLAAAGLHNSWVFQKARILAIFDDLDCILLLIPLKVALVGFKWELSISVFIMLMLLGLAWKKLHAFSLPCDWKWTIAYSAVVVAFCKMTHHVTEHYIDMEAVHIEVLLPAFVIGTIIDTPAARHELQLQRRNSELRRLSKSSRASTTSTLSISEKSLGLRQTAWETQCNSQPDVTEDSVAEIEPTYVKASCVSKTSKVTANWSCEENTVNKDINTIVNGPLPIHWENGDGPLTFGRRGSKGPRHCRQISSESEDGFSRARRHSKQITGESESPQGRRSLSKQSIRSFLSKASSGGSAGSRLSAMSLTRYGVPRMIPKEPELAAMGIFEETIDVVPEEHEENMWEPIVQTSVSMTFMFLVGLSIPAMFGINAEDNSGGLGLGTILCHVIAVSGLMTLGKMFCLICYRDEVNWRQRLALSLGMCPRGEVGASIIVIALELGMEGPTIIVALCALGGNLVMSGAFIALVKYLVNYDEDSGAEDEYVIQTAFDGETFNETPSTASPDTINDNVKDLDDVDDDCIIGKIGDTVVDAVVVQEVNSNDDPDKDTAANPGVVYLS